MKTIQKPFAIAGAIGMFLLFFNGITRHDVSEDNYLAFAKEKQFDCIVPVFRDTASIGSGVLISDRHVLTAAHIIVESDIKEDTIVQNNNTLILYQPYNVRLDTSNINIIINGQKIRTKKVTPHPGYAADSSVHAFDLLLIELEEPVKGITPAVLNTRKDEMGAIVAGCGFGASGRADKPEDVGQFNKKIAGENTIDSLCGQKVNGQFSKLMADFDHPTRTDCNPLGSAKPLPLEYAVSGGDSGGGLFRQRKGKWELIGICSGSAVNIEKLLEVGYYGQTMTWTRVSVYNDWIKKEM